MLEQSAASVGFSFGHILRQFVNIAQEDVVLFQVGIQQVLIDEYRTFPIHVTELPGHQLPELAIQALVAAFQSSGHPLRPTEIPFHRLQGSISAIHSPFKLGGEGGVSVCGFGRNEEATRVGPLGGD